MDFACCSLRISDETGCHINIGLPEDIFTVIYRFHKPLAMRMLDTTASHLDILDKMKDNS